MDEGSSPHRKRFERDIRTGTEHYRLSNYEIIVDEKKSIVWRKLVSRSMGRLFRGFIMEDILFLTKNISDKDNTELVIYHKAKDRLPIWAGTTYYAVNTSLVECRPRYDHNASNRNPRGTQYKSPNNIVAGLRKELGATCGRIASEFRKIGAAGLITLIKIIGKCLMVCLKTAAWCLMQVGMGCWNISKRLWMQTVRRTISLKRKRDNNGHD